MTLTIKKTLKFMDVYIAYLPLVVFLLNFLYGFLNLEGSTVSNERSRYDLLFGVVGLLPTIFGYIFSFLANLIVGITYVIKAKNRTKCLIAFLLIGNVFLALFLMFLLKFKMIVSFDFIKDLDLWSFIFSLLLFPYIDWIYQNDEYDQKVSRMILIIILAGIFSPFLGSEIQTYLRNNAKVQQLHEFYHSRGLNYELTLKSTYYDSNISDVGVFDVVDNGVTIRVGAKYTRQKLKYVTFIDQDYGLKEFIKNAVTSDEAQIVLKDFRSVVEDAIKKKGYDLSVFDDEDQPLASPGFQISRSFRITSFIKEKAVQNQNSSSPEKQAFGGYAAISLKDYMKEGALRLCLRLSESDKLKLEDIDFSRLSDGHYKINNDYFIVNNGMYTIVEDEGDFENFLLRESSKQFYLEDFYKIEKLD
ncbi:glutamyl-tRNA amidotransferase [Streptococcus infantis]|uniref:glutamyl-tRNA amidotransferase n=1 Tax=Streptococcus infantis TaxID=68892 RepID=UPI0039C03F34